MKYLEFRELIKAELQRNPPGLTWAELRDRLDLPYIRPCPTWVARMEREVCLFRARGPGRAYLWKIRSRKCTTAPCSPVGESSQAERSET